MKQAIWKRWMKTATFGMCAVVAAGVIAGCGNDAPVSKDVLKIGVQKFADTLEPTEQYFSWTVMRYGIGEALVRFDETMNITPWLAESWTLSDDKTTWTFKIRDNVKFSNGNPLTAEAVKASLERSFEKSKRASKFFTFKEMKAEGQTLTIVTEEPNFNVLGSLGDPLFLIVDTKAEKERDFAKEGPIGTGPYVVKAFSKEKATLEKNPTYWGGDVPFKSVELPALDDPTTRSLALKNGDVDMAVNIAPSDVGTFKDDKKFSVSEIASLRTVLARMNHNGVLGDAKLRQAVISGADRKAYADVLLKGTFIPGKAPIPPSLDYGFDTLQDPNPYNPDRSKQLLAEAGWNDSDSDGYVDKDGKNLELNFVIYTSRAELPKYAEALQADLKKVGIKVNVSALDYSLLEEVALKGEYDLLISNYLTANTGNPHRYLSEYWKSNINDSNPLNASGYSNPRFDEIMDLLVTEFDDAKRKALVIEAQQILLNDSAALFFGYPKTNLANSVGLSGVTMFPADYYWVTNMIKPAK